MARRSKTYVEIEGQEDLRRAIAQLKFGALEEAKIVIADSADEIQQEAQARVPVLSGKTKRSIRTIIRDFGLNASIGTGYFLGRFIEQGTRSQPAKPFLNPAFELVRPKYLARLERALNKAGDNASTA
jgi:HK97 gp10 family phage protein